MAEIDKPRGPRVVWRDPSRTASSEPPWRLTDLWTMIRSYLGLGRRVRQERIDSAEALARFLDERASFVAQTSLYGYLRTRAGMRYPELFDDDPFVASINIAKWHVWLDCLGDIAVYAGSRLAQHAPRDALHVGRLITSSIEGVLAKAGMPPEAGSEFEAHARQIRDRVARTDWLMVGADEAAFTASPASLVRWAPVMDELKALDEEIVRNSVRFRWQEVRRDFQRNLDTAALLAAPRS